MKIRTKDNIKASAMVKVPQDKDRFVSLNYVGKMYDESYPAYFLVFMLNWTSLQGLSNFVFYNSSDKLALERQDLWFEIKKNNNSNSIEIRRNLAFIKIDNNLEDNYYLVTMSPEIKQFTDAYELFENVYSETDMFSVVTRYKGILPHYTNIEGGYGVFGAYLTDTLNFKYSSINIKP